MRNLHTNQRDGSFASAVLGSAIFQYWCSVLHTKGTVLLVCFQCVDTLVLVLKHAEGMSLRCDVICALAYCGRHESSHIVKAHADLALWEFLGSHRFNEIQQDNNL